MKRSNFSIFAIAFLAVLNLITGCQTPPDKVPCTSGQHVWGSWQVDNSHYYAEGGYGFYRVETRECEKCHLVIARRIIPE